MQAESTTPLSATRGEKRVEDMTQITPSDSLAIVAIDNLYILTKFARIDFDCARLIRLEPMNQ